LDRTQVTPNDKGPLYWFWLAVVWKIFRNHLGHLNHNFISVIYMWNMICRFHPSSFNNQKILYINIPVPHGSLSKYTHFFLFIFWWHQIFSFPFCFRLLVFPTWHIHTMKKKNSKYVAPPHTFQSVVLPT
jgi:hypothetical protein